MITSSHNEIFKKIFALREARDRRESGLILIDGAREIERALKSGVQVESICIHSPTVLNRHQALIAKLKDKGVSCFDMHERLLSKLTFGERNEGIVAVAKRPRRELQHLKLSAMPLVVVVQSVEKPGNLGAIVRSCDAAGVEAIIIADPKTDIYHPHAIRSSIGTLFAMPVVAAETKDILSFLQDKGIAVVSASPRGTQLYTQANFRRPLAIAVGAEDQGLDEAWLNGETASVVIPMQGIADSLNVSVSVALLIFEAQRQRRDG